MNINAKATEIVAGVIVKDKKVLVALRGAGMTNAGKWEFPGGKLNPDEKYEDALVRELKEELDVAAVCLEEAGGVEVDVNEGEVLIIMFIFADADISSVKLKEHSSFKMVNMTELKTLDMTEPDKVFIKNFESFLKNKID